MGKVVVDTNILLDEPEVLERFDCVILSHVVRELENHKRHINAELAFKARQATRYIEANLDKVHFDSKDYKVSFDLSVDANYTDNKIIECCRENGYGVVTDDLLLKHKSKMYGVELVDFRIESTDEYTGYKEVEVNNEELAHIQENSTLNTYGLYVNQYLIASHPFGKADSTVFKWNGTEHVMIDQIPFTSDLLDKFKSKDAFQQCAMDSVRNNDVTLLQGPAGSGKTLISLSYAISEVTSNRGNFGKIIMFTGNTPVAGTSGIGFLPGTREEKLAESGIGNILSGKLGSRDQIYALMQTGKLELLPMSDIRGYDTGSHSIIILTEAQNTSKDLMKLALQRVGDGSKVIIDGDATAQVDKDIFAGARNGMRAVSKNFRGEDIYGEVTLREIRRSKIAKLAGRL